MKPTVAPGSPTRLRVGTSGPAHTGRDGRNEELSFWRRAPTRRRAGVSAQMARTSGDDPCVQTVPFFFLLGPGLRHLYTAMRDGGLWGRAGGACGLGGVLLGQYECLTAARTPAAARGCAFEVVVAWG